MIRAAAIASLALAAAASGCGDESTFTIGRELEPCQANIPTACPQSARCVLDDGEFIEGRFPGARRFVVRTEGEADLRFGILLADRRAPGTTLELTVYEPSCGDRVLWDSAGQDLFRLTGSDGVLVVPARVNRPGDHLVEVVSDAYAAYALKLEL